MLKLFAFVLFEKTSTYIIQIVRPCLDFRILEIV